MASRLLAHLDTAIAAASSTLKADCLRIERAGLLARLGRLDDARQVLASLHMRYASHPHPTVSAWLSWAEGLLSHFHDLGRSAHDRMKRAHALSGAVRDAKLQALMTAWLALMEFLAHDFEPMGRHLSDVLQYADPGHHAARARACLVVADAYHCGGRFDLAQPWYAKGRQHANAEGDEAMLSAGMHNMAWLHALRARREALCGHAAGDALREADLVADSAANFDALIGTAPLDAMLPILRATILSLQGKAGESLALFDRHLSTALGQGLDRLKASLYADVAWCRLQLGQTSRAQDDARVSEAAIPSTRDVEERAAAHGRLALVYRQLGENEAAVRHAAQAQADWQAHGEQQVRLVALLDQAVRHALH